MGTAPAPRPRSRISTSSSPNARWSSTRARAAGSPPPRRTRRRGSRGGPSRARSRAGRLRSATSPMKLDPLADEGQLLGVVELEAERAGRRRGRERRRSRPRVEDDRPQPGRGRRGTRSRSRRPRRRRRRGRPWAAAGRRRGGGTGDASADSAVASPPIIAASQDPRAPGTLRPCARSLTGVARSRARSGSPRPLSSPCSWRLAPAPRIRVRPERTVHRRRPLSRRLPELEAQVPTTYMGRAPDTLDSGRNCSSTELGTLTGHGLEELRFAGGDVDTGGELGGVPGRVQRRRPDRGVARRVVRGRARGPRRTRVRSTPTRPKVAGQQGYRLDTINGDSYQTVIIWPSATRVPSRSS